MGRQTNIVPARIGTSYMLRWKRINKNTVDGRLESSIFYGIEHRKEWIVIVFSMFAVINTSYEMEVLFETRKLRML
jgi:hypothetical protein